MRFHTIHSIYVENAGNALAAQAFPETETKSVTYYHLLLKVIILQYMILPQDYCFFFGGGGGGEKLHRILHLRI